MNIDYFKVKIFPLFLGGTKTNKVTRRERKRFNLLYATARVDDGRLKLLMRCQRLNPTCYFSYTRNYMTSIH